MTIEDSLDLLESIIENSKSVGFTNKKMVDEKKVKEIIEDIRLNMPGEIRKAQKIVVDREIILEKATADAKMIIKNAEKQHISEVNDIITDAKDKSTTMRKSAIRFVDDLMRLADDALYDSLSELRRARESFKSTIDADASYYTNIENEDGKPQLISAPVKTGFDTVGGTVKFIFKPDEDECAGLIGF